MDINNVLIVGRLARDPERRADAKTGNATVTFTIATKISKKGPDGKYLTNFFNCVAYGSTADIVSKFCIKGSELGIVGELRNDNYKDKNGNAHYKDAILVRTAHLGSKPISDNGVYSVLLSKKSEPEQNAEDLFGDELEEFAPVDTDELPF